MEGSNIHFIMPPGRELPSGEWAPFECCIKQNNSCLRGLCINPLVTEPISWEALQRVHSPAYLGALRTDRQLLFDLFDIKGVQGLIVTQEDEINILTPSRAVVNAVVTGARKAFEEKSIVIVPDGGSHHASAFVPQGSCLFSDVPLAWALIHDAYPSARALYIDVDVHHANGFAMARAQLGLRESFFMIDLFNEEIWPFTNPDRHDEESLQHVNIPVPFQCGIGNKAYLALLSGALKRAEQELPCVDMVFYMCANDAMIGDPLGMTRVTQNAIYARDRMVTEWARSRYLPLLIMPSRGYGVSSCRVARESMARLNDEYNIF